MVIYVIPQPYCVTCKEKPTLLAMVRGVGAPLIGRVVRTRQTADVLPIRDVGQYDARAGAVHGATSRSPTTVKFKEIKAE